jgi:hypothetical protein
MVDSAAFPDLVLLYWMQFAVGTLMNILKSRLDLTHSVHQLACLFIILVQLMSRLLIIV